MFIIFFLLVHLQLVIRSYAAITAADAEDLTKTQVPVPISCNDPACRGISWAVLPYRCRQRDGVIIGMEVFGCRCCPRLIDCDDPACAGSSHDEICRTELLDMCVCVSSNQRAPAPPIGVPVDAAAVEVEGPLAELTINELSNNDIEAIPASSRICPRDPPVKCLDSQCRGSDDWKTETLSNPRCNKADGKLFIDGTEITLQGCPCCPEYIACSSTDCNGGVNRACTSVSLHGCFCDWPSRGRIIYQGEPTDQPYDVLMNDAEAFLDDPEYLNSLPDPVTGTTTSSSSFYEARPLPTHRSIPGVQPHNLTEMESLPSRQQAFRLSQNGSMLGTPDYFKHT